MANLLRVLGYAACALLIVALLQGIGMGGAAAARRHIALSFAATVGVLLHQSFFLVFYLGITRRLRELARAGDLSPALIPRIPPRAPAAGGAALGIVAAMAAAVLGAAAHTGRLSPHLHGAVAGLAVAIQCVLAARQGYALDRLRGLMDAAEGRGRPDRAPRSG